MKTDNNKQIVFSKKIMIRLLHACVFMIFFNNVIAQDLIIKKNNEQIKAKIIEIGTTEVKFKYFDAPDGPIITISKSEIRTIKIQGKTEKTMAITEDPMSVSNNSILDKTSAIKFNFFSPLNRHIELNYEWMYRPAFNFEAGVGVVGPGIGPGIVYPIKLAKVFTDRNPQGAYIKAGCKFLLGNSSDVAVEGVKFAHPLKGRYFKAEIVFNNFSTKYKLDTIPFIQKIAGTPSSKIDVKNSYLAVGMNLIYGRQFIFGNSITVGYYVGFGYAWENKTTNLATDQQKYDEDKMRYAYRYYGKDFPLTLTGGLNIGYIMKAPSWMVKKSAKSNPKDASRHSMENE